MDRLHALTGILAMLALSWAIGERRRAIVWRPVWAGLTLALVLAALLRWLPGMGTVLAQLNRALDALQSATAAGTAMVFGYLGGAPLPFPASGPGSSFVLAAQALPLVLVVSALSALLFHWGLMGRLVGGFAWLLERTLGIGGAAGMSAAANVFVGMVEAPVVVRPWLAAMSRGELFIVMNCGMATVAGTVLVLYASLLKPVLPDALGHLLAASVIAIPVAIAVAALMVPGERGADRTRLAPPREDDSTIGAIARGTAEGMQQLLNIVAMLVVFVALVALVNAALGLLPAVAGAPLSAERILGVLFAPLAWLTGVPWAEAATAGQLLGKKTVLNEFLAYADLAALPADALSPRSRLLMTYALAGFANFGSLGIMVGGLTPMLPAQRRAEFGRLALLSVPAGLLSTCITAAIVGIVF
ncbi:MAG: nucleoside:proton symporter [Betaproteobacteria bacterium]|nr:nucleoside:proton symporter [Betaproteobacteria bacterium]